MITTLASAEEQPLFLVEGEFDENAHLEVTKLTEKNAELPPEEASETASYSLRVLESDIQKITVRYLTDHEGSLRQINDNGSFAVPYIRDGQYIVFDLDNGGCFSFTPQENMRTKNWLPLIIVFGGMMSIILLRNHFYRVKRRYHKKYLTGR